MRMKAFKMAAAAAAGAAGALLLDPQSGRRRRSVAKDRLAAAFRRRAADVERRARYVEGRAEGMAYRAAGAGTPHPVDDRALTDVVRQFMASVDFDTSQVNVDAVDGVVTLRGQVQRPDHVRALRDGAAKLPAVQRVESYLHLPGTPAPNKADAVAASAHARGDAVVHHGA